jgi:glucokinase
MTDWVLALDVGGTKLAAGLMDRAGQLTGRHETSTLARQGGGPAVMERLMALSRQTLTAAGFAPAAGGWQRGADRVVAVGLGTGGQVDPDSGAVIFANENIPRWTGMPARQRLEDGLNVPAAVDNDGNCAALAEATFGAGRGYPITLCVVVGTGIGGGLVNNGRVFRGAHGGALEVGHILVDYQGLPCVCGLRGCLEMYASGPSILAEFLRRHGEAGVRQLLQVEPAAASTRDVVNAAGRGLLQAREVVERAARFLGIGLASMAHVLDPSIIVIGGGMSDVWEMIYAPMSAAYAERSMPPVRHTPIVRAQLGADAVLIGAGQLAWQIAQDRGIAC